MLMGVMGGVMLVFGIPLLLFGLFLLLSAPIWTTRYFEMMLITIITGASVIVMGALVIVAGLFLLYSSYKSIASKD